MRIPQKLVDKAIRDYEETKSVFKTAKRVGLGSSTVHRILKSNGVECDGLKLYRQAIKKLPDDAQLLAEYESGDSASKIAKRFGCSQGTAVEALHKAGAKMRSRGNSLRAILKEEAAVIAKDYAELKSQMAVAALHSVSQSRVSRALQIAGVAPGRNAGSSHPSWKGGRIKTSGGYVQVLLRKIDPMWLMANTIGYVMEHRLVMARALGRHLTAHETVHHINGDKKDNRLSNLQLRFGKHGNGVAMRCATCGSADLKYEALN